MNVFWIATTARTGSNYFCDLLFERAQIQTPKEFLNPEFLRRHNLVEGESHLLLSSLTSFFDYIGEQWQNTVHPLCVKALYSQIEHVLTLPDVREVLGRHTVVMLVRRDIVAQAVSQHIARSAGHWISGARPRRNREAISYDFAAIDAAADRIERHNAQWRRTFQVSGLNYQEISYEQVKLHPAETVDQVIELWGLTPREESQAVPKPHRSQTTDLNAQFIEQYRHDKARAIFEVTVPEPSPK